MSGGSGGFVSFNDRFSGLKDLPTTPEIEDEVKKPLKLKYNWVIWEQIMQSSDQGAKAAQYSDATRKVASFGTVQDFWRLWNHVPQPSELLDQKRMIREQADGLHVPAAVLRQEAGHGEAGGRGKKKTAISARFHVALIACFAPDPASCST